MRLRSFLCCAALLAGGGAVLVRGTEEVPGAAATASHPRVPVLIGNPCGPIIRVTVTVGKRDPEDAFYRDDLRLRSITFVLSGTDDLRDLESLSLLATGNADELRLSRPHFGPPAQIRPLAADVLDGPAAPASALTFHTDRRLEAGKNVFWLAARLRPSANLLHRLGASCTAIGTSGGWLTAEDDSPGVRQRIGVALRRSGQDGVDTSLNPVIAATTPGTLLCAYDMRWNYPGHDLQDRITIGLSRSPDRGQTWEPVRVIMDMGNYGGLPANQNGCSDPGIIADRQTGQIFVFAVWMHGRPGHHQWVGDGAAPGFEIGKSPQFLVVNSRDDGRTWSKPENLTRKLKREAWWLLTTAPQQGIQLADGTLVMPVEGRDEQGRSFATLMTSRDHGADWKVGQPILGGAECQAAQLGDGSLMLNIRNVTPGRTYLHRLVYVTRDFGQTWQAHPTNGTTLIEPECNASLLRMDYAEGGARRHVLLFSNPHTGVHNLRTDHVIQVSFDDGLTWPVSHHAMIDEGLSEGYSSLVRIDAQRIGVAYVSSQADIAFQVLALSGLLHP